MSQLSDLDLPPDAGLLQFRVSIAPVSFQAPSRKKEAIITAVRAVVAPYQYLLSGDVKVEIEWGISQRARYESDSAADVDNIVKPILDAMSGPDGILVDDCQVQELTCYWTGGFLHPAEEKVSIELQFDPDAYYAKAGLRFLHIEKGLYYPIHGDIGPELALRQAEHIIDRFQEVRDMVALGADLASARLTLPIQRVFHRSKIGAFRTITIEEMRGQAGDF